MNCECAICKNNKPFDLPTEIIDAAEKGDLVLFCGAGISTEGKNVMPYSFYSSIREELKIENTDLSFSTLMQKYCDQPNGRKKLLRKIRERFEYIHSFPELERQATAFHRELSEIPYIQTIVTTNWDTYFEDHCGAIPITIPADFAFLDDKSRFVIKIHGSIDNLSSLIATSEDYQNCFKQLQNGVIGAQLKTLLATKTVVFIGFSFGDEDFEQIMYYLRNELGELYPHIYYVTLDETLKDRLAYKNSTSIVTSGTYFMHELKLSLIERGLIKNCTISPLIATALESMEKLHNKVSQIDMLEYPSVIYTLAYQDGVIHSFERFFHNYHTGKYNIPGHCASIARTYETWTESFRQQNNFWDEAYYEGYINGLVLLEGCEEDASMLDCFPFLYLPNSKRELSNFTVFMEELTKVSKSRSKANIIAKKIIQSKNTSDLVFHHPPY